MSLLDRLPRFSGAKDDAYKPGLERMRALLEAMGNPQQAFPSLHVAGTNGKGSTASMAASIAQGPLERVGLHTTPHLTHVTELMRVNGTPAPEAWLDDALQRYAGAIDDVNPSYFEATVALSFLYFAEQEVDLAVVEVGLGGRLDATNVLQPVACAVTSIDLEHTHLLGDTLAAVAREKAGIFKRGVPAVTGVTQPEALQALRRVAADRSAPLHPIDDEATWTVQQADLTGTCMDVETPVSEYTDLHVALPGRHQVRNAVIAIRLVEEAFATQNSRLPVDRLPADAVGIGLSEVRARTGLRGRLDVLHRRPWVLADVAHNPSSLEATLRTIRPHISGTLTVGLALATDKDADAVADVLREAGAAVIPLDLSAERMRPAGDLAEILRAAGGDVQPIQTPRDAVEGFLGKAKSEDGLLMAGSHRVVEAVVGEP